MGAPGADAVPGDGSVVPVGAVFVYGRSAFATSWTLATDGDSKLLHPTPQANSGRMNQWVNASSLTQNPNTISPVIAALATPVWLRMAARLGPLASTARALTRSAPRVRRAAPARARRARPAGAAAGAR